MPDPNAEAPDVLLKHLETLSGKSLRTREDVDRFVNELSLRKPEESPAARYWQLAKQATWLLLLLATFLEYYFVDIMLQIDSIPEIRVSVPKSLIPKKTSPRI